MFVDRILEKQEVSKLLSKRGNNLVVIYGRRRVGKTRLLREAWPHARTFYFLASNSTPDLNRSDLIREIAAFSGTRLVPEDYPTWRTVLRLLFELEPGKPLVVVLDEFQYLQGGDDDVTSQLVALWDLLQPSRPFVLALAGSAVSTMADVDGARSPLYGRVATKIHLKPLDYYWAGRLSGVENLRDRAVVYGVFGGTPTHLELLDPEMSIVENISKQVLSPGGQVRYLVETMIEQEAGLRKTGVYRAILDAIARGKRELAQIGELAGVPVNTVLRRNIETLEALGYIESYRNYGAKTKDPFRYRLRDPALMYHTSQVSLYRHELETADPLEVWHGHLHDRLDTYMGHVFERIVETGYYRLRAARNMPSIAEWSRWEGVDRNRESLEIDIVARSSDGRMLTGAIKWNREALTPALHFKHLQDLQRLADSGQKWARDALKPGSILLYAAAGGFSSEFFAACQSTGHEPLLWTLEDLYGVDAEVDQNFG